MTGARPSGRQPVIREFERVRHDDPHRETPFTANTARAPDRGRRQQASAQAGPDAVGTYDVVLIESLDQAYSHIKRLAPQLVIICLESDNLEGAQVLSMLNLDKATSGIPVITYLAPGDAEPSPPSTLGRASRVD